MMLLTAYLSFCHFSQPLKSAMNSLLWRTWFEVHREGL